MRDILAFNFGAHADRAFSSPCVHVPLAFALQRSPKGNGFNPMREAAFLVPRVAGTQQISEAVMQKVIDIRVGGAQAHYTGAAAKEFLVELGACTAIAAERS